MAVRIKTYMACSNDTATDVIGFTPQELLGTVIERGYYRCVDKGKWESQREVVNIKEESSD